MDGPQLALIVMFVALLGYFGSRIIHSLQGPSYAERIIKNAMPDEELLKHSGEFSQPELIKVTDGVYVAVGFALANSILLEGPEGLVIVDVTESIESASEILKVFRNVTDKPIKALIYTHNHADHSYGAKAFIEDEDNPPDIWAHDGILGEFTRVFSTVNGATYKRSMRQFGVHLPGQINAGIGLKLKYGTDKATLGVVYPTHFVHEQKTDLILAGINMTIIHIPGETDDQIGVWIPEKQVLLCADDIYKAFPNLYAIRGTPSRDLMQWVRSLDLMLTYDTQHLVPSHTRPVSGKENIREILTVYRDAIQYIHDQSVRYINQGFTSEEIVEKVALPKNLARHPYLKEFYGTVAWSVKGVFNSYLGWFSGNPIDLQPLTIKSKSERMVKLIGVDKMLEAAKKALKEKDFQWALELSSYLLIIHSENYEARDIKIDALTYLGARQVSACGRNYYLTCAFEEAAEIEIRNSERNRQMGIKTLPIRQLFMAMPVKFKAEECMNVNNSLLFSFSDTSDNVKLTIRNSVAIVSFHHGKEPLYDVKITVTEKVFRELISSRMRAITAYGTGEIIIDGGIMKFRNLMNCFENR